MDAGTTGARSADHARLGQGHEPRIHGPAGVAAPTREAVRRATSTRLQSPATNLVGRGSGDVKLPARRCALRLQQARHSSTGGRRLTAVKGSGRREQGTFVRVHGRPPVPLGRSVIGRRKQIIANRTRLTQAGARRAEELGGGGNLARGTLEAHGNGDYWPHSHGRSGDFFSRARGQSCLQVEEAERSFSGPSRSRRSLRAQPAAQIAFLLRRMRGGLARGPPEEGAFRAVGFLGPHLCGSVGAPGFR